MGVLYVNFSLLWEPTSEIIRLVITALVHVLDLICAVFLHIMRSIENNQK